MSTVHQETAAENTEAVIIPQVISQTGVYSTSIGIFDIQILLKAHFLSEKCDKTADVYPLNYPICCVISHDPT